MSDGKQTTFAEIAKAREQTRGDGVETVLNQKIVVTGMEMAEGNNGPLLILTLHDGRRIRTGGGVLVKNALLFKSKLDAGETVELTIVSKKSKKTGRNYYDYQ